MPFIPKNREKISCKITKSITLLKNIKFNDKIKSFHKKLSLLIHILYVFICFIIFFLFQRIRPKKNALPDAR